MTRDPGSGRGIIFCHRAEKDPAQIHVAWVTQSAARGETTQVVVFSAKPCDRQFLDAANTAGGAKHRLNYLEARLSPETFTLAQGADAVCAHPR